MKILNLGSMNLDFVYAVDHFVRGGETIASVSRQEFCGGKGLNQSIALARAGAQVFHAGCVGPEGSILSDRLAENGVDVSLVKRVKEPTGHAVIQVDPSGQNCIIIYGGANQMVTREDVDRMLEHFETGDILLLQNETGCRDYAIRKAAEKGLLVALNPSPIDDALLSSDALVQVHWFILNEIEGHLLTEESEPEMICKVLREKYPGCRVVLTLGSDGSMYDDGHTFCRQEIFHVPVVDTTAAGDTFAGYFLAGIAAGNEPAECLRIASMASAIAVGRSGASDSIPTQSELNSYF